MQNHSWRPSSILPRFLVFGLASSLPLLAIEEGLQELRLPPLLVEKEMKPETGSELPAPSYPVSRVDQLPFHGAWHEFVNVTTGGLVFRVADMKLPGRMPIDFGRIYDSKVSDSLPPPPPGGPSEAPLAVVRTARRSTKFRDFREKRSFLLAALRPGGYRERTGRVRHGE